MRGDGPRSIRAFHDFIRIERDNSDILILLLKFGLISQAILSESAEWRIMLELNA